MVQNIPMKKKAKITDMMKKKDFPKLCVITKDMHQVQRYKQMKVKIL